MIGNLTLGLLAWLALAIAVSPLAEAQVRRHRLAGLRAYRAERAEQERQVHRWP